MSEQSYSIGGKTYFQRPLVLGQIRQLQGIIQGIRIDPAAGNAGMVAALGDKLPLALAVVLTLEGADLRTKNMPDLAEEIEFAILPEQIFKVVDDFFICNPMQSLLERVKEMAGSIRGKIAAVKTVKTGSKSSSACSPEETSPAETASCGDLPPENAAPTSSTAPAS